MARAKASLLLRRQGDRARPEPVPAPGGLDPECPLFVSGRGDKAPMTRSAMQQSIHRLCRMAGMSKRGVSPHAFRRTFAVTRLRSGPNVFRVQNLLGHTNLTMSRRYCAIAEADIQAQHRLHSPANKLTRP